jgi:hypothetical protein
LAFKNERRAVSSPGLCSSDWTNFSQPTPHPLNPIRMFGIDFSDLIDCPVTLDDGTKPPEPCCWHLLSLDLHREIPHSITTVLLLWRMPMKSEIEGTRKMT